MNKEKIISLFIVMFFIAQSISTATLAQNQQLVSKFERVQDLEEYSLRISFHSWGEGRTEQLNLDQYFPVKRNPNSRYAYLAPPEISVRIDQDTGIAYLQAFEDWTGTREIIFTLTDVFKLESAISSLQKYREIITQQRAPVRLKEQFQDLPSYLLFEKILDGLETEQVVPLKIEVSKDGNNIKVNLGTETKLELDLETLTEDNVRTLKPKIGITIQPESKKGEIEESGLSFFIFIPLILIGITLIAFAAVYVKNNKEKFKKYFKKEKQKQTLENKLMNYKKELAEVQNRIGKESISKSTDSTFKVIKEFFNEVTPSDYQFSYSEIKKEQLEKDLSNSLKESLSKFSKDISDIRFKGDSLGQQDLKKIISQAKGLIEKTSEEEKYLSAKKEKEVLSKKFPISVIKYILDSFRDGSTSAKSIQEKISVKKQAENIFHKLGIIKTLAEKEIARKREFEDKLKKIKEKEKQAELARKEKEQEKKRKELLKIKEKQQEEHLKWLEAQRKIHEILRKQEEKRKRRLERAKAIRDYFHDKFGLFKTVNDLEIELEEKRKKRLEKEKQKRLERKKKKQAVLNFLHFLRLYKTPEEKHQEELILKREERLERQQKDRKREARKQAVLNFFHALKLYRTQEEVEKEKERRLRKLRDKQKQKEQKFHEEELARKKKQQEQHKKALDKLNEKREEKHKKNLEIAKKKKEKELTKEKREEYIKDKKKEIKKILHDKLGFFKTLEEKQKEREKKYHEKLRNEKIKKQKHLEKLKTQQQEKLRKQKLEEKHKAIILETKKREKEINDKEKEKQRAIKLEAQRKEKEIKNKERELAREKRKEQVEKIKLFLKQQLNKHFGLYKTRKDIELEKQKIKKEIDKNQERQKQKELNSIERKNKIRKFLHDKFGLFKTREEILKAKTERKEHRTELEHKLEDTILKALASRLERKKLTPEQEIKILMQMEQEALKKGDTKKSREIQAKINSMYKKVKRAKNQLFIFNKIANSLEAVRDKIFSSEKQNSSSGFIKKLSSTITNSLAPKIEDAKIDQINYLVEKSEIELKRNKKEEAKEFYQRAVYLYRSMNRPSRRKALPLLLKVKHQITSVAIIDSFEKAFSAIYTGQIKKAEKMYKDIDLNFMGLPVREKEKLYDQKEKLYEEINEKSSIKKENRVNLASSIGSLFSRKEKQNVSEKIFPLIKHQEIPVVKQDKIKNLHRKETLSDFIFARKPKFPSIKTEITSKKYEQSLTKKLFEHIKRAESHLEKKNHEKAHQNYKQAIDIFKDANLAPEIRDNVYNNLSSMKERILNASMHNFFRKTKESIKNEEVELAKKFHSSLEGIYNHMKMKKEKEINNIMKGKQIGNNLPEALVIEKKLNEAFAALRNNKTKEASDLYNIINNHYNNLTPEEKKLVYPRLSALYSELMKMQR